MNRRALLLHGFTGSARSWDDSLLSRLRSAGIEPQPVDLPGHGETGGQSSPDGVTLKAALKGIDALARDVAGSGFVEGGNESGPGSAEARRVDVVGYSMGGRLALHFAARYPERVRRLVLESASPGLATGEERTARRAADAALADRIERDGIEAFVNTWEALPLFSSQAALNAEVRTRVRDLRLANDPVSLAQALRGLGTGSLPSLWDRLPYLRVPTLVLVGEQDRKFVEIGKRMVTAMPEASLLVVPHAGHAVHLEAPDVWGGAVSTFLAEADAPSS